MKHNNIVNNSNKKILEAIKTLQEPRYFEISVACNKLLKPNFDKTESERLKEFETFLEKLEPFKNLPCLYVFEVVKGDSKEIVNTFKNLNLNNKAAVRKNIDFQSKTLYVGKSKNSIQHRMKVHFGYKNTTENGLQLLHWIKPLQVELKLHVYCFTNEIDFLLPMYEKQFNENLKPLIGYL